MLHLCITEMDKLYLIYFLMVKKTRFFCKYYFAFNINSAVLLFALSYL